MSIKSLKVTGRVYDHTAEHEIDLPCELFINHEDGRYLINVLDSSAGDDWDGYDLCVSIEGKVPSVLGYQSVHTYDELRG